MGNWHNRIKFKWENNLTEIELNIHWSYHSFNDELFN